MMDRKCQPLFQILLISLLLWPMMLLPALPSGARETNDKAPKSSTEGPVKHSQKKSKQNKMLARGASTVDLIHKLITIYGKSEIESVIREQRQNRITLAVNGQFTESFGPPNDKYVTVESIQEDLKRMKISAVDFKRLLDERVAALAVEQAQREALAREQEKRKQQWIAEETRRMVEEEQRKAAEETRRRVEEEQRKAAEEARRRAKEERRKEAEEAERRAQSKIAVINTDAKYKNAASALDIRGIEIAGLRLGMSATDVADIYGSFTLFNGENTIFQVGFFDFIKLNFSKQTPVSNPVLFCIDHIHIHPTTSDEEEYSKIVARYGGPSRVSKDGKSMKCIWIQEENRSFDITMDQGVTEAMALDLSIPLGIMEQTDKELKKGFSGK